MDPKFNEVRDVLKNLILIGMPQAFIEQYLGFSSYIFRKYVTKLKREEFRVEVLPLSKGLQNVVRLYTGLTYSFPKLPEHVYESLDVKKLEEISKNLLQVDKINAILKIVTPHIQKMREYRFDDDVPSYYQDFINNLNHFDEERNNCVELFNGFSLDLAKSKLVIYKSRVKDDIPEAIAEEILKRLRDSISVDVKPRFERNVCQKLHRMFHETMTERETLILESYFGLGRDKISAREIAPMVGVSFIRVNQIKEKAVRRCRHTSRKQFLFDSLPIVPKPEEVEHVLSLEGNTHLVSDSAFPVNVMKILLNYLEITTLEELQNYKRKDLSKYRGLGRKNICKIEDELMKHDLHLKD